MFKWALFTNWYTPCPQPAHTNEAKQAARITYLVPAAYVPSIDLTFRIIVPGGKKRKRIAKEGNKKETEKEVSLKWIPLDHFSKLVLRLW